MVIYAFIRIGLNPLAIFLRDDCLALLKRFLVVLLWYIHFTNILIFVAAKIHFIFSPFAVYL